MTAAAPQEINRDRPKVGRPGQLLSIEGARGYTSLPYRVISRRVSESSTWCPSLTAATIRFDSLDRGRLLPRVRDLPITIDKLCRQAVSHGVLQRAALAVVQHLMGRGT
jgi:hypothetical protein